MTKTAISIPYTEALSIVNLFQTNRKLITFCGTENEEEKVSPTQRQTVSLGSLSGNTCRFQIQTN